MLGRRVVRVEEGLLVCHEVCPKGGAAGVQGDVVSLLVTVAEERAKPAQREREEQVNSSLCPVSCALQGNLSTENTPPTA